MLKARVQEQLQRILQSSEFRNSLRMQRFLNFVVEAALNGTADSLKEQVIGLAVFDKDPSRFDPRTDPIVRNDARRLRRKLEVYYTSEGRSDGLRIAIPKGGYTPVFTETGTAAPTPAASPPLKRRFWGLGAKIAAAGLVFFCLLLVGLCLSFSRTPTREAYQKYVLGRQILKEDYKPRAIPFLQQAVQLDPKFAEGYAGLGVAYSMAVSRHQLPREGNLAHAKELFQKALELDPNSAEAYSGLGALEAVMNADFFASEHWYRRSLAARPQDAFTHFTYARLMLLPTGRLDQAASEITKSIKFEPTAERYLLLCRTHVYRRDWEHAIAAGLAALQLSMENSDFSFEELAEAYAFAGRREQFTALRNQYFTTNQDRSWTRLLQANGAGDRAQVRQISSQLLTDETSEFKRAVLFSLRDDLGGVIASLQKANETRPVETRMQARNSPYFDAFRSKPEFQALLRSMRLLN